MKPTLDTTRKTVVVERGTRSANGKACPSSRVTSQKNSTAASPKSSSLEASV